MATTSAATATTAAASATAAPASAGIGRDGRCEQHSTSDNIALADVVSCGFGEAQIDRERGVDIDMPERFASESVRPFFSGRHDE